MARIRLTLAQAIVRFLINQYVEQDGQCQPFFAGLWGIFGHGNIGGIAQAAQQYGPEFRYYLGRNEQAMVHSAIAYAKLKNRRQTFACLSSIGPGATNMVTGAATATVNRIPVLLLAGDVFGERVQAPVLQQIESEHSQDFSANDSFRAVCRYWDRLYRPEQAITALPEMMRVLTSPADTGAAFLALPQDIQTYAFDYPEELFFKRVWKIPRNRPDLDSMVKAVAWIRESKSPLIIAGGGVRYSGATDELRRFSEQTGIPVAETHSGKGSLRYDHPLSLGAAGVSGSKGANIIAEHADLVIGIGTRFTDFPTASKTAFRNPNIRFININVFEMDAYKHAATPLVGDAKATLTELLPMLEGYTTSVDFREQIGRLNREWNEEVERLYQLNMQPVMSQGEVIGEVEASARPEDIVVSSAGSLPGDLLKLWRCRDVLSYQVEYGYSVMGYEVAGGLGAKMAAPDREVYVMVGDGSFLMMSSEIVTSIQEGLKLTIVLVDNLGFSSVGRVSEQVGSEGFGCHYRYRGKGGWYDGAPINLNFPQICAGYGADVVSVETRKELAEALRKARTAERTTCIYVRTDWHERVPGYATCWWDMATAQVSTNNGTQAARSVYEREKVNQRYLMLPTRPDSD
jgi:3D-(3,5/4)-trihydroxycyclohexane-1,2-dione acylhydrolase (decyclizing)